MQDAATAFNTQIFVPFASYLPQRYSYRDLSVYPLRNLFYFYHVKATIYPNPL
jgi:hypothetical protein